MAEAQTPHEQPTGDEKVTPAEAAAKLNIATESQTEAPAENAKEAKPRAKAGPLHSLEPKKYIWGTGRRKAAVARVRIRSGSGKFLINKRGIDEYFTENRDRNGVIAPLRTAGMAGLVDVWVNVKGGGYTGQAGAVSLGLARALAKGAPEVEHDLRDAGLLTRDARVIERKKYGQRGARRRFQFSKR